MTGKIKAAKNAAQESYFQIMPMHDLKIAADAAGGIDCVIPSEKAHTGVSPRGAAKDAAQEGK